ncbi:YolD-like family protein [Staphylococcus saprophyticus]|uniref:YolD-like family protein n=1 Tax=Staphylococcus saprophyticus TaxID=29385 RepID=UPI002041A8CB|nr:YolD-like family protein [Staphylococcus saprophyticus]MCM3121348.1 YolD-like family protein [Staphylococcus saprophyticus]
MVVNPDMPDEYKNETDYRKIPRENLNPNIPQGRGIVKWAPFKTMALQYEMLEEHIESQNKIALPQLSDDQLEAINMTVAQKLEYNELAILTIWEDGYVNNYERYILKVDTLNNTIHFNGSQKLDFPLNHILSVL